MKKRDKRKRMRKRVQQMVERESQREQAAPTEATAGTFIGRQCVHGVSMREPCALCAAPGDR